MGMVCCVAKIRDRDDDLKPSLKHYEIQNCISPSISLQSEVDSEDDEDITRFLTDYDLYIRQITEGWEAKCRVKSRVKLKDDGVDATQREVDHDMDLKDDEGKSDTRYPDDLKADEISDDSDVPQQQEGDTKDQVQDITPEKLDGEILSSADDRKVKYSIHLLNLPTELLVKILLYLPICDRIMMRYVSQRFQNVAEIPLLWREFTVYSLKRHHIEMMENLLKVIGEHVRKVYFGGLSSEGLDIVRINCRNVTHLIFYETVYSAGDVKSLVNAMPNLQFLELSPSLGGYYYDRDDDDIDYSASIVDTVKLLIITVRIKTLNLVLCSFDDLLPVVAGIQAHADKGYALPSIINIFGRFNITATNTYDWNYPQRHSQKQVRPLQRFRQWLNLPANLTDNLFEFWSTSAFNPSSFEICIYDMVPYYNPMNLFPDVPVRMYKFGPAAAPTLIQLGDYGIVGLKDNIFHFTEYIDHGMVSHAVTLDCGDCESFIEERHITCAPHLHMVSYVDISYQNVNSNHLQQLAIACPNLQQLHLKGNVNCLEDLWGLQAIVDKCEHLKSLNLAGIPVSWVESYLLLWDILSSLKKLTLLTIDLCMIMLYDFDNDDKHKLVTMCRSCHSLLALNVQLGQEDCVECNSINENFLFSHFPSLTYCGLWNIEYSSIAYAFTNCRRLKYLNEYKRFGTCKEEECLLHLSKNIVIYTKFSH